VALGVIGDDPVLGVGPEGYRTAAPLHTEDGYARRHGRDEVVDRAHSGPLDVTAAGGVPAGVAYVVLVGGVVVGCVRVARRPEGDGPPTSPVVVGAAVGVVAWAVQQLVSFPIAEVDPAAWLLAGLVLGGTAGAATGTPATPTTRSRARPNVRRVGAAVASAVLLAGAVTAVLADRELERAHWIVDASGDARLAEAVRAADRATDLRPEDLDAWYVAARVAASGRSLTAVDAGLDRVEAGLARSGDDPALRDLHEALLAERALRSLLPEDLDAAEAAARAGIADDPAGPAHHRRLGGHTVALVSTTWFPDVAALFPEMGRPSMEWSYNVETRDEGLVLTRAAMPAPGDAPSWDPAQPAMTAPPQPAMTAPAATAPPTTATTLAPGPDGAAVEADRAQDMAQAVEEAGDIAPPEDVRTVPWSELGAEGPDAMTPQVQVFRRAGEAWEELPDVAAQFAGMVGAQLDTSGDRFVATGYSAAAFTNGAARAVPDATAFASADGVAWTPLSLPIDGTLTSVGPALFAVSFEGDEAQVSGDGGATWSEVDLAAAGVGGTEYVMGVRGGPLGVALTIGDTASWEAHTLAVSGDLVDWTTTPIADVFGGDFPAGAGVSIPAVGEDTIALTRSVPGETSAPVDSLTVVGTPTR